MQFPNNERTTTMYVSEEMVQEAKDQLHYAQDAVTALKVNAPAESDYEWERAYAAARGRLARLSALVDNRTEERAATELALAARQKKVAGMQGDLEETEAELQESMDQVNAAIQAHMSALVALQRVAAAHNALVREKAAHLAGQGLYATDELTAPGEHHPSGSNGRAGVYVRTVLWAPVDETAIALRGAADVLCDLRTRHLLSIRPQWRLDGRADGLVLPSTGAGRLSGQSTKSTGTSRALLDPHAREQEAS
jgi:hypothetical protein